MSFRKAGGKDASVPDCLDGKRGFRRETAGIDVVASTAMSSELGRAEVERIAALAHLELTEEEKALFTRQLAEILHYAEQVQQVDTTGVAPTAHVLAGRPVDRADEPRPSLSVADALANAPDPAPVAGLFKVPQVIG